MAVDPFRSARLFYRAIDSPEDEDFFHALSSDPLTFAGSTPALLVPPSRKSTTAMRELALEGSLLLVIICLPTTPENLALAGLDIKAEAKDGDETEKDKKTPKSTTSPSLVRHGLHDRGIPVGSVALRMQPGGERYVHHRCADVGIDIAPKFQNKGYGSEAIKWILEWGFKQACLHRIGIRTLGWNEGALRLYQRLGFVLESRERERWWQHGRWWDDLGLGMLEEEWKERYQSEEKGKEGANALKTKD